QREGGVEQQPGREVGVASERGMARGGRLRQRVGRAGQGELLVYPQREVRQLERRELRAFERRERLGRLLRAPQRRQPPGALERQERVGRLVRRDRRQRFELGLERRRLVREGASAQELLELALRREQG